MGVAYAAARRPDHPAVLAPTGDRSFAELNANANRLTSALRARGFGPGDAVAVLCANRAEFFETWAACTRAGFRLTTVNWHLTPDEAAYIVADSGARAFVADAGHAEAVPAADGVELRIAVGGELPGFESWDAVLAEGDPSDIADPTLGTAMLYTSGTTGYPKGVRKPPDPDGLVTGVAIYGHGDDDVHLCTGPLYHAAPFALSMVVPLTAGIPVVVMDKWDPIATLELIERHRVTHTHLVPTMFHRLLSLSEPDRARFDVTSLKVVLHGAAPCPVEVKQQMIEWWGPVLIEYYAATEGAGTVVDSATWLRKPGTVGLVDPQKVFVGDDSGQRLPAGEEGLVWLQAAGVARFEYFGDTDKTARSYRGDHFTLGDVGRIDDDGYLFLTDRSANLIISGGVNIYPAEVDAVLLGHRDVADAATIGIPDDEWGEIVVAVVEAKPGATASADDLVAWCRTRLAAFKCPRRVDFVDRLPRDDNGKLYKRRLRDQYRAAAADR
jgi:long-chain acyl-CoA synthetase